MSPLPTPELAAELEAHEPPEARGLERDEVRLMVVRRAEASIEHARFRDLPAFLQEGDALVVNVSATLPAALPAWRARVPPEAERLELHLSTPAPDPPPSGVWWVVELRADGERFRGGLEGMELRLPGCGRARLRARVAGGRLWLAQLELPGGLDSYLARHGQPVRYRHVPLAWRLDAYQNVYATEPGSAEMPSAGRPFTPALLTRLMAAGVQVAPLVVHTGVSSPEQHEPPYPERFRVPEPTARLVNSARAAGARVIAVGTTVVRALETMAAPDGVVSAGAGWTRLVVSPERGLWAVDGLITGWHEPQASHLELLRAAAGDELIDRCYAEARAEGYLWHEFGDSCLLLP